MPKLSPDTKGRFNLPADFLERRRLDPGASYWLDERDGDLIFLGLQPLLCRLPLGAKYYTVSLRG